MKPKIKQLTFLLLFSPLFLVAQGSKTNLKNYKFIENGGQWPADVLHKGHVQGGNIWLEKRGILYEFKDFSVVHHADVHQYEIDEEVSEIPTALVYAHFVGANKEFEQKLSGKSSDYFSFFLGNDESKWAAGVHSHNEIEYLELYDGIDLRFYEKEHELKYEYRVRPEGNYENIKVQYQGYEKIELTSSGNLVISTEIGQIIEQKPFVYQIIAGRIKEINSKFVLKENTLSFEISEFNPNLDLIIDPVLIFATYSGSPTDNYGMTATYAYDGKAYSGGIVFGSSYPTPGPAWNTTSTIPELNPVSSSAVHYGITDVFITKYSENGSQMLWTCFLGGGDNMNGSETVHSLVCDSSDNVYMFGATSSVDFPTINAFQPTHNGGTSGTMFFSNGLDFTNQGTDLFLSKLSSDGMVLMGSSYYGGSADDGVNYTVTGLPYNTGSSYDSLVSNYGDQFRGEIILDQNNDVIVATCTRSDDISIINGYQSTIGGQEDGLIFKVSNDISTLLWSTYVGGSENDALHALDFDSNNNVVAVGGTSSSNFGGTAGTVNPAFFGGKADGVIVKVSEDGTNLISATHLGTTDYDQIYMVDIDENDHNYVIAQTDGAYPVFNANYSNPNSGQFITKLNFDFSSVIFSTTFGSGSGEPDISPSAFSIDPCENIFVSGWGANIVNLGSPLSGMPITNNAYQSTPPNGFDFYLFALERDAENILYGSYIGGDQANEHVDGGTSRFDEDGVLYQSVCGGCGGNSDFSTTPGAWSSTNDSQNCNNLVFKFDFQAEKAVFQMSSNEGCIPFTIDLNNLSSDTVNYQWIFPPQATVISSGINAQISFNQTGTFPISLAVSDPFCSYNDTLTKFITAGDSPSGDMLSNDTTILSLGSFDLVSTSYGTGTLFTWYDNPQLMGAIVSSSTDSILTVNPTVTTTYYVKISNGFTLCDIVDSVTVTVPANISIGNELDSEVKIYPNPFDEQFIVETVIKMESIEVLDVQGKVVAQHKIEDGFKEIIKADKFAEGTYLVKITFIDKSVLNRILIK